MWKAEDYGAAPINYRVLQHPVSGFIYAANFSGVLEFDGATWRLIRLPLGGAVRSLAVDARGRVWAGGRGELCVLAPDSAGRLQAVDMAARLPRRPASAVDTDTSPTDAGDDGASSAADPLGLGLVDRLVASPDAVFVRLTGRIARFGLDDTVQVFPAAGRLGRIWWMAGALHADDFDQGVVRLRDGALTPAAENPLLLRPFDVRPGSSAAGPWDVLTERGPVQWAGEGQAPGEPPAEIAARFRDERPTCAAFLPDGRRAYGMPRSGLLIFDAQGRLAQHLHRAHGLPANRIAHVAPDREGGLWLAMQVGLVRIQLDSPFAVHGAAQGFTGSPRHLLRLGSRLYVTHGEGFAWREDATGMFHNAPEFPGASMRIDDAGDHVLVSSQGLFDVWPDGRMLRSGTSMRYGVLALARHPGWALAGSETQVWLYAPPASGTRRTTTPLAALPTGANAFVERADGFVWALLRNRQIFRIDLRGSPVRDAPAKLYDQDDGLPDNHRHNESQQLLALGADLLHCTPRGIRRYDEASDRFVPDARFGPPAELGDLQRLESDGSGGAWVLFGGAAPRIVHAWPAEGGARQWTRETFSAAALRDLLAINILPDPAQRTLWIAGGGALVSFDPAWQAPPAVPFSAVVRRIETAAGETIFGGEKKSDFASLHAPLPTLRPTQNALRLAFAAPAYVPDLLGRTATVYRTRLDGLDGDWTPWSPAISREFTNLPYRAFTFRVQARDLNGRESAEGTFAFAIAAPWWLTRPALVGYGVLALLGIGGIFRLRTRALRQRNLHLEELVAARTAELERLRRLEMDEKISARLAEEKARLEVLRYQLNPHFLFNSLNAIYTLVWTHSRPAGDLVRRLAEFCRMTLTRGGAETATLAEEFAMLRAYLDLERSRWHEQLEVEFFLAPEIEAERLPPFLLLPLVENAIKYGGHTSPGLLQIRISARRPVANLIVIEIANSGTWVEPGSAPEVASTNIGLENLRQRLARHFPGTHEFTTAAKDGWVVARLRLNLALAPQESGNPDARDR